MNNFTHDELMKLAVESMCLSFIEFKSPKEQERRRELNETLKDKLSDKDWADVFDIVNK